MSGDKAFPGRMLSGMPAPGGGYLVWTEQLSMLTAEPEFTAALVMALVDRLGGDVTVTQAQLDVLTGRIVDIIDDDGQVRIVFKPQPQGDVA